MRRAASKGRFHEPHHHALIVALAPGDVDSLGHEEVAAEGLGVIAGDGSIGLGGIEFADMLDQRFAWFPLAWLLRRADGLMP